MYWAHSLVLGNVRIISVEKLKLVSAEQSCKDHSAVLQRPLNTAQLQLFSLGHTYDEWLVS